MGSTGKLFLLALGLTFVLTAVALICPYNVKECNCYRDTMACENLETIPPLETGHDVIPIIEVIFEGGTFTNIPKNSLPANLTYLEIHVQSLTVIDDDAFLGSATTLQSIGFTNMEFPSLPRALLKITRLRLLGLTNTKVGSWDSDILDHLATSVDSLWLLNVGLSAWPGWLSSFHLLNWLELENNLLYSLPDDAVDSFKDTLEIINLGNTGLTQVPKALSVLTQLTRLNISSNNILDVNGRPGIEQLNSFLFANTLETLDISSIGLGVYPNLSNLTRLSSLTLSNNRLTDASAGSLPASLAHLYLDGNQLLSVPAFISNLSVLYNLRLANNSITEISFDLFHRSLFILDLRNNKITKITDATSKLPSDLRTVRLSSNPISTISNSAFTNLVSLFTIGLDSTSLTRIPSALTSLPVLSTLNLLNNTLLTCPCPPEPELVQWFKPYIGKLTNIGFCNQTVDISDYLTNPC